jgi:hypothetical protein
LCFTIIFLFCLVPIVAEDDDAPREAIKDGAAIDAMIDRLYAAVSFPVGSEPDWDAVRSLVLEEVVFAQPDRGPEGVKIVDLEGFFELFRRDLKKYKMGETGFSEKVASRTTTIYGNIAHSFVIFEPRLNPEGEGPCTPGVDSIQFVKKSGKWKIASITTQFRLPDKPFPKNIVSTRKK